MSNLWGVTLMVGETLCSVKFHSSLDFQTAMLAGTCRRVRENFESPQSTSVEQQIPVSLNYLKAVKF
jgi:hypothetical protein